MNDAPATPVSSGAAPSKGGGGANRAPDSSNGEPKEVKIATKTSGSVVRPGDRIFNGLATGSAALITVIIAAIGVFLVWRAIPALQQNQVNFLTSREWNTTDINNMAFGVLDLFQVTVFVSAFALLLAMPLALGIALYLSHYAPPRVRRPLAYTIDLLAAVPSIVYGLWGILIFAPAIAPFAVWLNENLSFIPFFATGSSSVEGGGTIFTAGIVLAVMVLPIITAVSREVFTQTPVMHIEAALALGATKWEVMKTTVLPFGRSGYISGSMLGLGRALGETMALYMILRTTSQPFGWSVFDGGSTIASKIALGYAEFNNDIQAGAYIAAGLVLFVLTFLVNAIARSVVANKAGA